MSLIVCKAVLFAALFLVAGAPLICRLSRAHFSSSFLFENWSKELNPMVASIVLPLVPVAAVVACGQAREALAEKDLVSTKGKVSHAR